MIKNFIPEQKQKELYGRNFIFNINIKSYILLVMNFIYFNNETNHCINYFYFQTDNYV